VAIHPYPKATLVKSDVSPRFHAANGRALMFRHPKNV